MKALEPRYVRALHIVARRAVDLITQDHPGQPVGAYLCVTDRRGLVLLHVPFGEIPDEIAHRCYRLARNNAEVVAGGATHCHGGAVECSDFALSLYGLPDRLDRAVALAVAVEADVLPRPAADGLARIYRIRRYADFLHRLEIHIDP